MANETVQVKVDGKPLPDDIQELLAYVRVEESVVLPDQFSIHFYDPEFSLFDSDQFHIGAKVEIAFSGGEKLVTVTSGEVTAIRIDQGRGTGRDLTVIGFDLTHRLHQSPTSRTFLNMSDDAVVRKIAGEHGLTADVDSTGEQHEYLVQRDQTDYEFLSERAERNGFDLWVTGKKLSFKKKPSSTSSPPKLEWANNLLKFKLRLSASNYTDSVKVNGWHSSNKQVINGTASRSQVPVSYTSAKVGDEIATDAKKAFGTITRGYGHVPVESPAEAKGVALSYMRRVQGSQLLARGEAIGDPAISAGCEVEIVGVGKQLSGKYLVTSVEHVFGSDVPYATRFEAGGKDPTTITDLLTGHHGQGVGSPHWGNLVSGVVTNVKDPAKIGRVKVQLPTLADNEETAWARVAVPGGGAARGFSALPEVNDEVLVGFEFGEMRRPVVLGGLWNTKDKLPPEITSKGQVASRTWVSRSGHRIELVDGQSDSEGQILIQFKDKKSSITIDKDGINIKTEGKVTVDAKQVAIKSSDSTEVTATGDLTLKGRKITIQGSQDITAKAPQIKLN